ncbi:hypothetical protein V6Z05_09365 [Leptospira venezuelensis]|nr:hypothetical protein [Leptospira venezuelensis]
MNFLETEQLSFPELMEPEPIAFPIPYCPAVVKLPKLKSLEEFLVNTLEE